MAGRKLDDQTALNVCQRTRRHDQTAITRTRERRHGPLDLAGVANVKRAHVNADRPRHRLDDGELADPSDCGGIPKDCRSHYARHNLFEQFQPFCAQIVFETDEAGRIAAGSSQTLDEAGADRIGSKPSSDGRGA